MKATKADNYYWPPNLAEHREGLKRNIADMQRELKAVERMLAYEKKRESQKGGWGNKPIPWWRFGY